MYTFFNVLWKVNMKIQILGLFCVIMYKVALSSHFYIITNILDLSSFQIHICCGTNGEINVLTLVWSDRMPLALIS